MEYLDFELPIKELWSSWVKCQVIGQNREVDALPRAIRLLPRS
jgi:hypothetical protein